MTPRHAVIAAVGVGALLSLVLWGSLRTPDNDRSTPVATTYSSGARGAKALYLLLEQSGLHVSRLRSLGLADIGPDRADDDDGDGRLVLWILAPPPLAAGDADAIVDFARRGGTVVAAPELAAELLARAGARDVQASKPSGSSTSRDPLDTPWHLRLTGPRASMRGLTGVEPSEVYAARGKQPIVAAYRAGEGTIVNAGLLDTLRNDEIGADDAGPFWVRLAAALGQRHAFDELHTGYGNLNLVTLLWQTPYRWVSLQVGVLLLFATWGLASRARPAERDSPVRRRETRDHVQAVANWWARSRDVGLPLTALLTGLEARAARRVSGGAGARRFVAWAAAVRPELGQRAATAWTRAEELLAQKRSPARELVSVAAELRRVEKEVFPC
ncbi:MAG TPA: DUF4350 domain-containing protein [Polyangia bacterium]|nr:DUF4350 domain-containing protein [Polyangia bacterium]